MDSDSDLQMLMARYQQGDSAAANALVQSLGPRMHRFFLVKYASRRYADDLLQETWLRIHEARHTYRCGQPVLPWFYAIARNTRVDAYRKAQRIDERERRFEEGEDLPERSAGSPAQMPDLDTMLAALPESQREVIAMLKVCDMSLEE